jgi:hypothetical protein
MGKNRQWWLISDYLPTHNTADSPGSYPPLLLFHTSSEFFMPGKTKTVTEEGIFCLSLGLGLYAMECSPRVHSAY